MKKKDAKVDDADSVVHMRIFSVPKDVASKFISLTKLHFNNEGWRCLGALIDLWMESEKDWKIQTENRLNKLEQTVYSEKEEEEVEVKTFGGKKHARSK